MPHIFIRINDSYRINLSVNDPNYLNALHQNVHKRYEYYIKIMTKFFTSNIPNKERWDFFEDYFLDKNLT